MPSVFIFSDQYRLLISIVKGLLVIFSAIGLTFWYLNLHKRTINDKQRTVISAFSLAVSTFLTLLVIDIIYPKISHTFTFPMSMSLALVLANLFLLCIIIPYADDKFYQSIRTFTGSITLIIMILLITNPFHKYIDITTPRPSGQIHWLINIFLYYGVACLLIGFFMYFSYQKQSKEWTHGLIALAITAILIIFTGYSMPRLHEWDIFLFLYMVLAYFVLIFNLIFRSQRGPYYIKNLPIFERADIMMIIVGSDGAIRYASHGISKQSEIMNELDKDIILQADGRLHILDKDDTIYQWSVRPVDNNYLITIENITDLMMALREKEKRRDELERQQLVMGTQSSIDQEVERIQYRLQLLANVETETVDRVAQLQAYLSQMSGPVTPQDIQMVKILARFIKRRSLISLENEPYFSSNWTNLVVQELLDIGLGEDYGVHINPELRLNMSQLKHVQDLVLELALKLLSGVELLLSVRQIKVQPELALMFRSSQTSEWRDPIRELFASHAISEDDDSMTVIVELEG